MPSPQWGRVSGGGNTTAQLKHTVTVEAEPTSLVKTPWFGAQVPAPAPVEAIITALIDTFTSYPSLRGEGITTNEVEF